MMRFVGEVVCPHVWHNLWRHVLFSVTATYFLRVTRLFLLLKCCNFVLQEGCITFLYVLFSLGIQLNPLYFVNYLIWLLLYRLRVRYLIDHFLKNYVRMAGAEVPLDKLRWI